MLEKVFSVDNKKIDPIFHVAKLREQQNQLATASWDKCVSVFSMKDSPASLIQSRKALGM